ncbi:hypothetical protein OH76DRAFT_1380067 [Lentinus brumalis]|uniref:Fungal-type protein kinase domain-containing protein n=1 Tax=Lentinus brumalis TaxID=2498619 RepID=A0A371DDM9_9APHY|nr:hypothetical protein OH76DRAFT_1380067 [Polyporus brumalis]
MTTKCIGNDKFEFADKYFPQPPASDTLPKPVFLANPFAELENANTLDEKTLQDKFIDIINQQGLAPGLKMDSCESRPDNAEIDQDRQKVDAAIWREDLAPTDNKPHWVDQLIPVEFKAWKSGGNYQDPYHDDPDIPGGVVVRPTQLRTKNFGQIISYAELVFAVQHRLAVFMLVVVGRVCRFLRWDHSGAVVTEAIDYYEDWQFFCGVLWRISRCSNEQLGVDPSATRLSGDAKEFADMDRAAVANEHDLDHTERQLDVPPEAPFTFAYVREMFSKSLDTQWPRYKLEVPDGKTTRHFLVCKPVFCAKGLIGRGTRGYVALDCTNGRFVWLKDAWRADYLLLEKEGDIPAELREAKVPFVPTVVCHGDIREQTTLTSQVWEDKHPLPGPAPGPSHVSDQPRASSSSSKRKWTDVEDSGVHVPSPKGLSGTDLPYREDCPLRLHRHYRLVVEEVAKPLCDFETGEQLVSIIKDCIVSHHSAATILEKPRLHRDVSGGNVLIYPQIFDDINGKYHLKWTGLLADWEMSKPILADGKRGPPHPERTGTWQYMSVALLSGDKNVEISDELEAFFYVLLYHAIRYLRSTLTGDTAATYLDEFFDQYILVDETYRCGARKLNAIETGKLMVTKSLELRFDKHLDDLVATLLRWFQANYLVSKHLRRQEEERRQQELQKLVQARMPPPPPPPPRDPSHPKRQQSALRKPRIHDVDKLSGSRSDHTREEEEPTAKQWKESKMVQKHVFMHDLLEQFLEENWPVDDKVGDRIPKTWVRRR